MCGILGHSHRAKCIQPGVFAGALHSLAHRGPDHEGSFVSGDFTLGAVRLRILDLEHADQPMFSPDRDVVLVFNGEIFNHHELREELEGQGYTFQTRCDTEVVLHAFLHWGTECFARFRGMFAMAFWVQSEGRLLLARDRMGIKPLYYCLQDDEVYFGSELKCILAHPEIRREISLPGLNCFLSLNYVPGPFTLVDGIVKLMPGEWLDWRNGHCSVRPYLHKSPPGPGPRSLGEACEDLDELLSQAVKEQLVADVPVGIWLSGGLDSSTILHYAAKSNVSQLRTFSVTFQGRAFDESKYISQVSEHYGTQHTEVDLNPSCDLADAIEQMSQYSDEPGADAGALPIWFLARMTSRDVTVALSGEGSDELFAGYLTHQADRYHAATRRIPSALRRAALAGTTRWPVSDEKISLEYKVKRFLQGSLLSPELAHVFWNGTFTESEKRELFEFSDSAPLKQVLSGIKSGVGLQTFLDFDQRYYLPDNILYKVDRMSMAHSLEVRPPFLDPRIVDFASGLPAKFKLRGSTSKYVLRELMRNKLPATIIQRAKIGFDIPIHEWFRGVLRPLLLDTLSREAVSAAGLRWPVVERLLTAHLERRANVGYHLWGLMILLMWMKRWDIQMKPAAAVPPSLAVDALDAVGSLSQLLA